MIAFGPVPSRRLGRSLGINHIPYKVCSYACIYCQVGPTLQMRNDRQAFFPSPEIVEAVTRKVDECRASDEAIDYLSFVPDGEPTLDVNLGAHIRALAPIGIPIAVITNASLLWIPEVRSELAAANLVSVKVDTTLPETWHRLNRPHGELHVEKVLEGIRAFAREYRGELISDTMLVGSVNDDADSVTGVADFLAGIAPAAAYLGVPTRPPTTPDVHPPDELALVRAYEIMKARLPRVALLPMHEEGTFARTGDPAEDLLGILAVHPMCETAVQSYLKEANADGSLLEQLIREDLVERVDYRGEAFCVRRFRRAPRSA
jgi:wyosine [tRNA(Phe)-imidazoG37] synthetase (radical SAM superfamily)